MKSNERFKAFIEGVCGKFGIAEAIAPLQKGFDAFLEAHDDAQPPSGSPRTAPVAAVPEAAEGVDTQFVEIDDFPSDLVPQFANGTWGDFVQYYGQNAIDDLKNIDAFMASKGLSDIIPPSTEEWEATYNSFNSHPAFGLATSTVKVYGVPGEWTPLAPQYEGADK